MTENKKEETIPKSRYIENHSSKESDVLEEKARSNRDKVFGSLTSNPPANSEPDVTAIHTLSTSGSETLSDKRFTSIEDVRDFIKEVRKDGRALGATFEFDENHLKEAISLTKKDILKMIDKLFSKLKVLIVNWESTDYGNTEKRYDGFQIVKQEISNLFLELKKQIEGKK